MGSRTLFMLAKGRVQLQNRRGPVPRLATATPPVSLRQGPRLAPMGAEHARGGWSARGSGVQSGFSCLSQFLPVSPSSCRPVCDLGTHFPSS
uniref:Uncharacterized protein n=1 Tax=Anas platyrhynchos platyrhynchos TaxID=8840 RepID=A0A493U2F1_ANAPP